MKCLWCEPSTRVTQTDPQFLQELPEVFCWTKMQAEAGQPLDLILRRKEVERTAGGGQFFWGIGTSVARKVFDMLGRVLQPKVLFSVMKAKPKQEDVSPKGIFLWTSYVDLFGRRQHMPEHAVVLSRAYTRRGPKTHHYALVCRSDVPLDLRAEGSIKLGHFRNLGSDTPRVGSSQVTAIIEHVKTPTGGPDYLVDLVADLAEPYFVRLGEPVLLQWTEKDFLDGFFSRVSDAAEWMDVVRRLKRGVGSAQVTRSRAAT